MLELQGPRYREQCGGFDKNNASVGEAIARDVCKVPTLARGLLLGEADDKYIIRDPAPLQAPETL